MLLVAALLAAAGLWPAAVCAQTAAPQARVVGLTGSLSVKRAGQDLRPFKLSDVVEPGDELVTDQHSEAVIRTGDGSTVRVFPDSRVIFTPHSSDIGELLHLFFGSIKVQIEKLSGRPNSHKVTTPTAVIAVRGTVFSVFVDENDTTLVAVDEGVVVVVSIHAPGNEVILYRGQRAWVRRGLPPSQAQRFRGRSEQADLVPVRAGQRVPHPGRGHEALLDEDTKGQNRKGPHPPHPVPGPPPGRINPPPRLR